MKERLLRSWELAKASASVLRSDRELMLFPLVSMAATLLVMLTFAVPVFGWRVFENGFGFAGLVWMFLFYFCQYTVIVFCNCALVAAAMIRLEGGDPTLKDGFRAALERIGAILGYAAIAATVGMLLRAMRDNDRNPLAQLLGGGLGVAWTMATFLVAPVLVSEQIGPFEALRKSGRMLQRTWGETAAGAIGIGLAFGVLMFGVGLAGLVLAWTAAKLSMGLALSIVVLVALVLVLLGLVQAALNGVYAAALFRYISHGETPPAFQGLPMAQAPGTEPVTT